MSKTRSKTDRTRREIYRNSRPRTHTEHGFRIGSCNRCGHTIWMARLDPESQRIARYRSGISLLDPLYIPGEGAITLISHGYVGFVPFGQGSFRIHRCPESVSECKYCGGAIRVINQPPGSPGGAMAVVDADLNPRGNVVVNPDGYAVNDPGHTIDGLRYCWHTRH